MSAEIHVGTISSRESGVARVVADAGKVTLTVTETRLNGEQTVSALSPALARGLAQLLNAAADKAEQ